jgi:hypothetical protein
MCFFSPNTDALTPLRSHATSDRAPDYPADGTSVAVLIAGLGDRALELCFVIASRIGEDHA